MLIVASNSLTVSNVNDGAQGITGKPGADGKTPYFHQAWSRSLDGKDRFTTVYPGENLLTNTSDFSSNWRGQSSISTTTEYNGHPSIVFALGTQQLATQNLDLGKLQNSTKYTASFWAKADNAGDKAHTELWGSIGVTNFVLTTNWVRYTAVLTSASDANTNISHSYCFFGVPDKNIGNVYIAEPKLEIGTVATLYTPSPLDDPEGAYPKFIGTYTDYIADDSTDSSKYTWAKIRGEQGPKGDTGEDGVAGKDGVGIKSTIITYQLSTSGTTTPTGTWSTTVPTLAKGQYLWTRTTLIYTDNTNEHVYSVSYVAKDGNNGSDGVAGKDGVGIKSTTITYAVSASGTSAPTSGWVSTPPSATAGQFVWTRTIWTYTDNTTETGYSVGKIGEKGADGANGAPGKPGADGRTPYFHQAWADSKDGKINFSATDPTNRGYLGTYTDFTQADSTDPTKYFWVELVGALSIGGRNYLADTSTSWQAQGSGGANQIGSWLFTFGTIKQAPFKDGEYVTVSFDYTSVGTGAYGTILPQFNGAPWGQIGGGDTMKDNGHVVRTVQWKSDWTTSGTATGIQIRIDNVATTRTVTVYNMQFERGNKDTDHKAAPEDTQEQIDSVNKALVQTNNKINEVPHVSAQASAPTSPKDGDQWWVLDADGRATGFKVWSGTAWNDSKIQQSLLNVVSLNAVTITGSTINGSKFTNNFDFTGLDKVHFQGVTTIANGSMDITWKIPENNQTGETKVSASGFDSTIRNSEGAIMRAANLTMGELSLSNGTVTGWLNEQDVYQNYTNQVQYLDGWYGWNNPISITRRGKMVTFSGYIAHNGGSAHINIAQFPAWAMPEHNEFIVEVHFAGDTGERTNGYGNLMLSTGGRLIINRGLGTGQHASFGYTFVGQDI